MGGKGDQIDLFDLDNEKNEEVEHTTHNPIRDAMKNLTIGLIGFQKVVSGRWEAQGDEKYIGLISNWISKWGILLQREPHFKPFHLKYYKQGEIVLVDFGFRIGHELGGRHYAVVLDYDNNVNNGMILLAPISSYNPPKLINFNDVDLGHGLINGSNKYCYVKMGQIGYFSKMRIEKPLNSGQEICHIPKEKLQEIKEKFAKKLNLLIDRDIGP